VHVYVDGTFAAPSTADAERDDIAAAFPEFGASHGFDMTLALAAGTHDVCAYAIEVGTATGNNPLLGCRRVTVPTGAPFGALDVVEPAFGIVRVAGWAIDPDTSEPIDLHVYVDRAGAPLRAADERADLALAFPGFGTLHGFDRLLVALPGSHRVCAYAIDTQAGPSTSIGCRTVVVPEPSPFGALDVARRVDNGVEVAGWAIDPDTAGAIDVHVYVDGAPVAVAVANSERLDVAAVRPAAGALHGFRATVVAAPGSHTVCVYAINVAVGSNSLLGCRSVG
jgi:hypothetical protein